MFLWFVCLQPLRGCPKEITTRLYTKKVIMQDSDGKKAHRL